LEKIGDGPKDAARKEAHTSKLDWSARGERDEAGGFLRPGQTPGCLGYKTRSAEVATSPVSTHELIDPFGLAYFASRGKLPHIWLDVQHGRAIDCIEPLNFQRQILNGQQAANRNTNTVGPILSPLRENADSGKIKPIARMTRFRHNFGFRHTMKEKNNLNVREISQAQEAVRSKSRRVKIDPAFDATPNIIHGLHNRAVGHPDRDELNVLRHSSIVMGSH
jgi:hypothetical protein